MEEAHVDSVMELTLTLYRSLGFSQNTSLVHDSSLGLLKKDILFSVKREL